MSETLYVEGPDHEAICEQLLREYGRNIRLISTERVRRGGVGGFFAREYVGVRFELTDGDSPSIASVSSPSAPSAVAGSAVSSVSPSSPDESIDPVPGSVGDPTSPAELTFLAALSASAPPTPRAESAADGDSVALSVLFGLDDEPAASSDVWSSTVLSSPSAGASPTATATATAATAAAAAALPVEAAPSAAALALDAVLAARRIAPAAPAALAALAAVTSPRVDTVPPLLAATLAAVPATPARPLAPPTMPAPAAARRSASAISEAERSGRHSISAGSITLQELIARAEFNDTASSRPVPSPFADVPALSALPVPVRPVCVVQPVVAPVAAAASAPVKTETQMEKLIGSLLANQVEPLAVTSPEDPAVFVPATFSEIDEAALAHQALTNQILANAARLELASAELASAGLTSAGSATTDLAASALAATADSTLDLPSILSPKIRIEALGELRALGIPIWMTPDADDQGLYRAIEQVVVELPPAPRPPSRAGEITVLVGPIDAAREAAAVVCAELRVPVEDIWTAGDLSARHGSRRITGPLDAARCATELRVGDVPAVVIVATGAPGDATHAYGWAAQVIVALGPDAVWAVADASRKAEDTRSELAGLGAIDALVVHSAERTTSPASVWELDIPVALLDGRPATAGRWAALLFDRLASHQSVRTNSDRDLSSLSSTARRPI